MHDPFIIKIRLSAYNDLPRNKYLRKKFLRGNNTKIHNNFCTHQGIKKNHEVAYQGWLKYTYCVEQTLQYNFPQLQKFSVYGLRIWNQASFNEMIVCVWFWTQNNKKDILIGL